MQAFNNSNKERENMELGGRWEGPWVGGGLEEGQDGLDMTNTHCINLGKV